MQPTGRCVLTIRLLGRTEIRRLAKELEFRPRKSLGQNFVHDANTVRRVVSSSGVQRHDHVLEVGPGLGSLTLALLDRGATVSAVEIDPVLAGRLPQTIAEHSHSEIHRLTVLNRDVLSIGPDDLATEPTAVVANLPYNIAVPALLHLLANFPSLRTLMVMVQAEVAERLAAEPGGKEYGVPSVKVRFYGQIRRYGMVSPTVFWPIPRVYSGLVRIERYETSPWPTDETFRKHVFRLVDVAFAQRRKTSRNAFVEWAGSGNESANRLLAASIDPARRGETLTIGEFVRLYQRSGAARAGDDAERSDEEERRVMTTDGDDAERSDEEERRVMTTDGDDGAGVARIEERRTGPDSNPGGLGLSQRHVPVR